MTTPLRVRNPHSGEIDYEFRPASAAEVTTLAETLRRNQPEWQARSLDERFDILDRWAAAVMARKDEIAEALIADTGRYRLSVTEVTGTPGKIKRWREQAVGDRFGYHIGNTDLEDHLPVRRTIAQRRLELTTQ